MQRILTIIDWVLPPALRAEPEERNRSRLLVVLCATGVMVALANAVLLSSVEPSLSKAVAGCAAALTAMLVLLRLGAARRAIETLLFASVLSMISASVWQLGGMDAGLSLAALIIVPFAALALDGPRVAAAWSAVTVALIGLLLLFTLTPALPSPGPHVHERPLQVAVSAVLLLGYLMAIASFMHLQNALQRREALKARRHADEANQAKSRFLANMSHELRTPLNGVLGLTAAVLCEATLTPDQIQSLRAVSTSGEHLVRLLDDILDFSKVEAGQLTLEKTRFAPADLVDQVFQVLGQSARSKGLRLSAELPDPPGWALGDPTRLRQILMNLVGNAIKFTPAGQVSVQLERRGDQLHFKIADSGIGIPVEQQSGLFQPFSQADATTTRRFGGTGIGLSISQRLVHSMGGEITLSSQLGKGSTFAFWVLAPPSSAPAPPDSAGPIDSAGLAIPLSPNLRVLVAEDNPVNQMVARKLLQRLGLEPTVVSDGVQALEQMRAQHWDVVLMDCHMPVMDGLECTERARKEGLPHYIVAMTAGSLPQDRQAALASGMDDFLSKPIDARAFQERLAAAQRRRSRSTPASPPPAC